MKQKPASKRKPRRERLGDNTPRKHIPLSNKAGQEQGAVSPPANPVATAPATADRSQPSPLKTIRQPGRDPAHLMVERAGVETMEETDARMTLSSAASSSFLVRAFAARGTATGRKLDATMTYDVIAAKMAEVSAGDLTAAEGMLMARACSLEAVATEFMRRATTCLDNPQATEVYMRIALKAERQMRANIEAIAEIKNPRAVFARQTNIANGNQQVNNANQQQVNNGVQSRAEENKIPANKLLKGE